jgi:nitrate/nitrite-specific signal transduction histidine kinase
VKNLLSWKIQITAILACILALSFNAQAADMGKVINLAGKQRMLTQKMSKEALLVAKGIDVNQNKANLQKTAALFDKTLKGLINGDADLGLPKTEDAAILAQLNKVSGLWAAFKPSIESAAAGDTNKEVLGKIATGNLPLLVEMNKAVKMYEKAASSTLSAGMAKTINLAGKQRMLTQKMTKELLLIANGIVVDENKANLAKTVALFDKTLKGLLEGDADLGLPKTEDAAIRAQLGTVQKLWAEYQPIVAKADTSDVALQKAAQLNLPLLKEMNKAVGMYAKSAK